MTMHSRLRRALLQASMLVAPALLAVPGAALAQGLAPNAAPQGGLVVGGAASIGQTAARTTIEQTTNRAVIDWRSFDVGRDHTVQFQQPSAQAMTLNRVTGPNPSVIAGHITANGGIALVNQSGVVFTGGAQVQAQSVIVSTNDIGNAGFMQGGAMVFDRAGKPGARIDNQGTITARQAGIAALVAPQVANSGVISARLGTVVLAGATQQVIDLNGDGLVSFAVGAPVRTAPADGGALVSNTGTLRAQGGTVLLTAAAADGIVQNLVRAGGSIAAATDAATGRGGTVLLSGTGGSIIIEGAVSATGRAPGSRGGSVTAVADRVLVAGTARIDASGRAGGGRIAVGTDGTRLAARTGIAAGAVLRADATGRGNGGQVVVNSQDVTAQAGSITARGGPRGGNGGVVEVSSAGGFQLTGQIDVGAAAGLIGQVIIDPATLTIVADGDARINVTDLSSLILAYGDAPADAYLSATVVGGITGNLVLQARDTLTVGSAVTKPLGDLELDAGNVLTINAAVVLGAGNLTLQSNAILLNALVQVSAISQVVLVPLDGTTSAIVTEAGAGRITAGTLTQSGTANFGDMTLGGANLVGEIAGLNASGTLLFNDGQSLVASGSIYAGAGISIDVRSGDLTVNDGVSVTSIGTIQLRAGGNIDIQGLGGDGAFLSGNGISLAAAFNFTTGATDPAGAGGITLAGYLTSQYDGGDGPIALAAGTGGIHQLAATITGATLTVQSGGDAILNDAQPLAGDPYAPFSSNQIAALGPSNVVGNFSLDTYRIHYPGTYDPSQDIALSGVITVGGTLTLRGEETGFAQQAGSVLMTSQLNATAVDFGDLTFAGDNQVTSLGTLSGSGITVHNVVDLAVSGPVTSTAGLTISVDGGNLAVSGVVLSVEAPLVLQASGNVAVEAGGTVTAAGSSTATGITLAAATPTAGFDISLPGSVTLAGTLTTLQQIAISAGTGGITQSGGQISAGLLALQSGGQALLNGAAAGTPNAIGNLRDVSAAGDFALDNGDNPLAVSGHVVAADILLRTTGILGLTRYCAILSTGCFAPPGTLDAGTGTVSLQVSDLVVVLPASTITGGVVEIAPALAEPMQVGGAAGSIVTGVLSVNQDALAAITANTLRLGATTAGGTTANGLQLIAPLTFAGTLDLHSLADITQTAGSALGIGTLTGAAGGAIVLTEATNSIGTVGDLSAAGDLSLTVAGTMTLAGLFSAPGQTVALIGPGGIVESGVGRIVTGTLTAQSSGGAVTLGGANQVGNLGASAATGAFTLNDGVALAIAAGVTVSAGSTLALTTSDSLSVDGFMVGTDAVALAAGTGINVSGFGGVTTPLLAAQTAAGDIIIGGSNLVDALGAVQTPGRFAMENSASLLTIGTGVVVRADAGISLNPILGAVALDGTLLAAGTSVTISTTSITEGANGSIQTGTLTVRGNTGDVLLTGANQVDQLGGSSANGNFTLNDTVALVVAGGTVIASGTLSLSTPATLTITGELHGGTVLLTGDQGISGFGVIAATLLQANAAVGDVALEGSNRVDQLGGSAASGDFAFNNVPGLTVPAGSTVTAGGALTLTIGDTLSVAGQLVGASMLLSGNNGITEIGAGNVRAGTLSVANTTGNILLGGNNDVAVLDSVTSPGQFVLNNVAPTMQVPAGHIIGADGGITLSSTGALALDGSLLANGTTVDITATSVTQDVTYGSIQSNLLTARATTGDLLLGGANQVNQLGPLSAAGDLTFNNLLALTVTAGSTLLAGGTLTLTTAETLTILGPLSGTSVVLAGNAGISESGAGAITTALLSASSSAGDVVLGGANQVDQLGGSTAAGDFLLNDAVALGIQAGATVGAGGTLSLGTVKTLAIAGRLAAPSVVLQAATGISETGAGLIAAPLLTAVSSDGDVLLGGANQVGQLGASSAAGDFTLNNAVALTVPVGATIAAGGTLSLAGTDLLTLNGQLGATSVVLAAGTGIVQGSGGVIITPLLAASSTAGDIVLGGANEVDALGNVGTPGSFLLANTLASLGIGAGQVVSAGGGITLQLDGALALDGTLLAAGAAVDISATGITEGSGGTIQANLLNLRASDGDIVLAGANAVALLGDSSTPGAFTFNDSAALNLPGAALVTAGGAMLITGGGDVVVDGHVEAGTLTLRAAGLLQINGFSAVATGGPLTLAGDRVVTTGLIASPGAILIDASSASLGGHATGSTLSVTAPEIAFTGLDAGGMQVNLYLGEAGTATGTLDAGGLLLAGGSGATLFGTVAGVAGGAAAPLGQRADVNGAVYPPPPPSPGLFTMNGCPIAVSVCRPLAIAPPSVASAPGVIFSMMDPRNFSELLTDVVLGLPTPTNFYLRAQPIRDPDDDVDLAPPNIRAEDF